MSSRKDLDYLADIREAIRRAVAYTDDLTYGQFLQDSKTQDAVVRNLEIIGEATKNLSQRLRDSYPQVPWRSLAGVRDRMIHHYFGVNYEIVWTIARQDLPALLRQVEAILAEDTE